MGKIQNIVLQQLSTFCKSIFLVFPSFPLQAPFHFFLNMGSKVFISVKRVVHSMKLSTTVLLQLPKQHLPSFFSEKTQYASTVVPYLKTSFYVIRVWGFLLLKRIIFNYFWATLYNFISLLNGYKRREKCNEIQAKASGRDWKLLTFFQNADKRKASKNIYLGTEYSHT